MPKEILFREQVQKRILKGVETIASAVSATLGPKGRNVLISRPYGAPAITKDGVTVAKAIELKDPYENMGAQTVKEAASRTADIAGDGTTTATILAAAIYTEGLKRGSSGNNPIYIKRGIDKAVKHVVSEITKSAIPVESKEQIKSVATGSANWDEKIGSMIADAFERVGKDGTIAVEDGRSVNDELDMVEGLQINRGYIAPHFSTNVERMVCEYENPYILLMERKLSSPHAILPILDKIIKEGNARPLIIIAEDVDSEALAFLVVNRIQRGLKVCAIKAPGFGDRRKDQLEDVAAVTGALPIMDYLGNKVEDIELNQLGSARKIIVTRESTTIIEGRGDSEELNKRIAQIKASRDSAPNDYEKEQIQQRLARITGGVAIIKVGATTEQEMKEKKDRLDDALHATKAAVEEGILPGGGVALLKASATLDQVKVSDPLEAIGVEIVKNACKAPLRALCQNAGIEDYASIINKVLTNEAAGYNVATETFEDLVKAGVIDPLKVTRSAIMNASSVASLLLTTEVMISDEKEEKQQQIQ